jgi:hypothetical protein
MALAIEHESFVIWRGRAFPVWF